MPRLPSLKHTSLYKPDNHGWRYLSQSGGTSARYKNYTKFLWFELATAVTSQVLKYGVITYTPYAGRNYVVLEFRQITPQ